MKTTINLPDEIWQRLNIEAANRKQKGFSGIITQAIEDYFTQRDKTDEQNQKRKRQKLAAMLFASITQSEKTEELNVLHKRRNQWRKNS
ncbi:MAG: hypothetical protein JSR44_08065 [Spirochaetes bacterium]|nr:hypothetical protein [Spirochaetota bacterium]